MNLKLIFVVVILKQCDCNGIERWKKKTTNVHNCLFVRINFQDYCCCVSTLSALGWLCIRSSVSRWDVRRVANSHTYTQADSFRARSSLPANSLLHLSLLDIPTDRHRQTCMKKKKTKKYFRRDRAVCIMRPNGKNWMNSFASLTRSNEMRGMICFHIPSLHKYFIVCFTQSPTAYTIHIVSPQRKRWRK